MELKVLAVTGGIAEGKSTLVDFLSTLGFTTWSADRVVRDLWTDPEIASQALRVLDLPPESDSNAIRSRILESTAARRALNALLHPHVMHSLETSNAEVYEAPLLIETCIHGLFHRVYVVESGRPEQERRLASRGLSQAHIDAILSSQLPTRAKACFADQVFRTNQDPLSVRDEATKAVQGDGLLQEVLAGRR